MNKKEYTSSCPRRNWLRKQALSALWKNILLRVAAVGLFALLALLSQSCYVVSALAKLVRILGLPLKEPFPISNPLPVSLFIVVWNIIFALLANTWIDLFLRRELTHSRSALLLSIVTVAILYSSLDKLCSRLVMLSVFLLEGVLLSLGYNYLTINRRITWSFVFALSWLAFAFPLILRSVSIANPGLLPTIFARLS